MTYSDIKILFEDNHILVAIKPQGVPSQADNTGDPDMLTLLKQHLKESERKAGNVYLGLIHRLDRSTGGVMVFAKTSKAAARLSEQIANGDFSKKYLAVTAKKPRMKSERLMHYLLKDSATNSVRVVPSTQEGAKRALMSYNILESNEEEGLHMVDVNLETGRTHQIRVQLATIGCPLYADAKYGSMVAGARLALWAYDLSFKHPTKDETMRFRVYPPDIFPWGVFNLERQIGIVKPSETNLNKQSEED